MRKKNLNPYKTEPSKRDKLISTCLVAASAITVVFTIWAANILFSPKPVSDKDLIEDVAVVKAEKRKSTLQKNNDPETEISTTVEKEAEVQEEVPTSQDITEEVAQIQKFEPPLRGEIILEFSDKIPLYSETMQDWRIHNGIDIKAPLGSEVYAVSDGTVENTYKDFKLGHTVVIDHGNGLKSYYCNLAGTSIMKIGRKINRGDVIALLGDTALYEISSPVHLHFEMTSAGQYVNPLDYFEVN